MLKLGSLVLDVPVVQAAISGYSDRAMRRLAHEFGAALTFTGLILAKTATHPAVLKNPLFAVRDDEHPVGAQLVGEDAEVMAAGAKAFSGIGYDVIDLNFACPAPKVLRRGRGGALLREPGRVMTIVRRVREAVRCPVLMKLRAGFDGSAASREAFWAICEGAAAAGVDGLIVHGRTVQQRYGGRADWAVPGAVKQRFPGMTVLGSGDMFTAEDVIERIGSGVVDGVAVARGAIGNPWVFEQVRAALTGRAMPAGPTLAQQKEVILRHFSVLREGVPERKAVRYFRKFAVGYCRRHPRRKQVQRALMAGRTVEEVVRAVEEWFGFDGGGAVSGRFS